MTLIFDLQNIIRSSVGDSEYSLSALSKLFKPFMRYREITMSDPMNRRANGTVETNITSLVPKSTTIHVKTTIYQSEAVSK